MNKNGYQIRELPITYGNWLLMRILGIKFDEEVLGVDTKCDTARAVTPQSCSNYS